jgi:hypothetical protein
MDTVMAIPVMGTSGGGVRLSWHVGLGDQFSEKGFRVSVHLNGTVNKREGTKSAKKMLSKDGIDWLTAYGQRWLFDPAKFRAWLPSIGRDDKLRQLFLASIEWLTDPVVVEPEVTTETSPMRFDFPQTVSTYVQFDIYQGEYVLNRKTRIFLSHKGANKPMVRRFDSTLKLLGFDPWLDEDAMPGGTELHRGIHQGMKDSCMAVFFVTPQFTEETYIRGELDLAVEEKTQRADHFVILALAMQDEQGERGSVPQILHRWVYKSPDTELEALNEIIVSLPIQLGPPTWKPGI